MSIAASVRVWESSKAKGAALLVLLTIADYTNAEGVAYPGLERISSRARISIRHVIRCIGELEKLGELEVLRGSGPHAQNVYRLKLGCDNRDVQMSPNPLGTVIRSPVLERERVNTTPPRREKIATGFVRTSSPTPPTSPRTRDKPVRVERAASPRPPSKGRKKPTPPPDPLMRGREAPSAAGALFGAEDPPAPPHDAVLVRDEFARQYRKAYPVEPQWGPAEAKAASRVMAMCRQACEKRKGADPERVMRECLSRYFGERDRDGFLRRNSHRFMLVPAKIPGYLADALGGGAASVIPVGRW